MAVANELAKRNESGLVRLAASYIGAFNNDFLEECPINFLEEEIPEVHLEPKLPGRRLPRPVRAPRRTYRHRAI